MRFRRDLLRLGALRDDLPVIAAVSGGADSLALLVLLHAELGPRCLAATVDHGLRPESRAEAEYVAAICRERGIHHAILDGPLPDRAGRTANVSARARSLRYGLLETHRREHGAVCVATAHHADDQLETMIMRLNRGSGVAGLAGIRERQGHVVRPVLEWRHETLVAITAAAQLIAIDDPNNSDDRFDRARLRKNLAAVDWLDRERFAHSAHCLNAADEALEWAADEIFRRDCTLAPGEATHVYRNVPKELHRRIVRRCVHHIDPDANCDSTAMTRLLLALLRGEKATVGKVLCSVDRRTHETGRAMALWRFRPAPPRRNT